MSLVDGVQVASSNSVLSPPPRPPFLPSPRKSNDPIRKIERQVSIINREARRLFQDGGLPEEIRTIIQQVLGTGEEVLDRELRLRTTGERAIPVRVSCRRFCKPDGDVLGTSLLCVDLSEIKLLQQKLLESERLASIGSLSANIAHEIKNPLVAIKSFNQLLPERLTDRGFLLEFARLMRKEVERIDQIVNNLLVWAIFKHAPISEIRQKEK